MIRSMFLTLLLNSLGLWANPYPIQEMAPKDHPQPQSRFPEKLKKLEPAHHLGDEVLRIGVRYNRFLGKERYQIDVLELERSGTEALFKRSQKTPKLGSYLGQIVELETGNVLFSDSVGTGMEYRLLTRAMSFRFPKTKDPFVFRLTAENPQSGVMEVVLEEPVDPKDFKKVARLPVEVFILKESSSNEKLILSLYAEGYLEEREEAFYRSAQKIVTAIERWDLPGREHFEVRAIFHSSAERLGEAKDSGAFIPEKNTFLGLYFPYWNKFGRWYHVLYPTRENKLRRGFGQSAYDYPLVLVDDSIYWGVGNYNSHTAIPSGNFAFDYLFLHEFGHFMGLNEEYEEALPSRTELSFAPGIPEPWSQNTTFLRNSSQVKWSDHVDTSTPIPTPQSHWQENPPRYGAYPGGYSSPPGLNHKPGLKCVMDRARNFCSICREAIEKKINWDRLGIPDGK